MPRFDWDKKAVRAFCDICKEECENGNRPQGYLTSTGYANLMSKLHERIGRRPSRDQCKNKWDQLKREYQQFMQLKNCATGLGWNAERGTIEADEAWWTTHLQSFPKHAKYRSSGSEHLGQLQVMYDRAYVTGDLSTPAGAVDLGSHRPSDQSVDEEESSESSDSADESTLSQKRRKGKGKGKRKRGSYSPTIPEDSPFFDVVKGALDKMTASCEATSQTFAPAGNVPSISDSMAMVRKCGVDETSDVMHTAVRLLIKPEYREILASFSTLDARRIYLEKEHARAKRAK